MPLGGNALAFNAQCEYRAKESRFYFVAWLLGLLEGQWHLP